ncbi:MAG: tetraacyldisaccharide 4'-kinase, partial [Acidobacteriota bacterium]|nr:tetraacyldisaccharide 4'-kinase [Acidobacteriota bacterium]
MESSALLLYRIIQLVLLPFVALYFLTRTIRDRSYRAHFGERLGFLPQSFARTRPESIWFHAVSVGEVVSVIPLIRILRADDPHIAIYLSTSTTAGRKAAQHQAATLVNGVFYCPLDYVSCVRRVLRIIKPALLVVLETEIWPNLYAETKRSGAKLAIVNGRISDRTWPRYCRWKRWICPILKLPDLVLVQSSSDRERYRELGTPTGKLAVEPNLKYDASFSSTSVEIETFDAQHVWIGASTVGPNERGSLSKHSIDEDDIVIAAFESLAKEFPKLLLILAPRQPARFGEVAGKLEAKRVSFVRRTSLKTNPALSLELPGVLLLDTIGELSSAYRLANVAFVGGSLAPRGGHNILEPAAAGVPIVVGSHMQNFASIAEDFLAAGAFLQIKQAADLLPAIRELLVDRSRARRLGAKALAVVTSRQGTSRRVSERLWFLYRDAAVKGIQSAWRRAFLVPLRTVWQKGGDRKRTNSERFALSSRPLSVPVISVGGITIGGSGKTPFAAYLVNRLKYRGQSPAILTRGYRRRSPAEHLVSPAGVSVSP